MTRIPCVMINDLLPLFLDGELSDETHRLIDTHLSECRECREILEDIKSNADILDLSSIPETLPSAGTFTNWMKRLRRIAASGLFAFILLISLVGLTAFSLGRNAGYSFTVTKVRSEPQLEAYFYENIPGLQRAESQGHVTYPKLDITFDTIDADLRLEKLWYTGNMTYVIYSLGGAVPSDYDSVGALLRNVQQADIPLTAHTVDGRVLFEGRYYSYLPLFNQKEYVYPATERRRWIIPSW